MSTLSELMKVVEKTTVEYDWKKYERMGEEFLKEAARIGAEYGDMVVEHQKKINKVAEKLREGKILPSSARRSIARHKISIKMYLEAAGEALKWELAEAYWKATDDLLNFITLIASQVIKAL